MKILQINSMYIDGSTGNICYQIEKELRKQKKGVSRTIYFYGNKRNSVHSLQIGNVFYEKYIAVVSRITGKYGLLSHLMSKKVILEIEKFKPDIVHLHNIHDHTLDIVVLFNYLKKTNVPVIWTFHDCWPFTGYCGHYVFSNCYKWKEHCGNCPIYKKYSCFFDKSELLIETKKNLYGNYKFDIIVPSKWLFDEVSKSFLAKKSIDIIYNGIDLDVFRPQKGNFRQKYNLQNKYIVLGVAYKWDTKKGVDIFFDLSKILPSNYVILLVGDMPIKQYKLPSNIIWFKQINNQMLLAELYTEADVFVNPTREEVLGLVNIESLACGTPVITNTAGGSPECIDTTCGIVVDISNITELVNAIMYVCERKPFSIESCIKRARMFDSKNVYSQYIKKYEEIM